MTCPLFVELCAGTAALSLRLQGGRNARPPVSRMGAKTGYADVILAVLGLRPGQGADAYLWCEPDDGARLMLIAYTDPELRRAAASIIRGWASEEPRALWTRLRDEGPVKGCPPTWPVSAGPSPKEAARWTLVEGWSGGQGVTPHTRAAVRRPLWPPALKTPPTMPATILPGAVDPREVARWQIVCGTTWVHKQDGRPVDQWAWCPDKPSPREHARRMELADTLPATILDRATDPPTLPPGTIAYIDPPYVNTTGYADNLSRSEVVRLARAWHEAGALVVVSEAEPIPDLIGDGWHAMEITGGRVGAARTFSRQQREWLTMSRAPAWRPSEQVGLFG